MRHVYVANLSGHDFSPAEEYGKLVFVSGGATGRFSANTMFREWVGALRSSRPDDYIAPTGLTVNNMIGAAVFARMHGRINLLLFRNGRYIERSVVLDPLIAEERSLDDEEDRGKSESSAANG